MLTFKQMIVKSFDLTKKYLNEKNAKIEMIYRIRLLEAEAEEKKKELENAQE